MKVLASVVAVTVAVGSTHVTVCDDVVSAKTVHKGIDPPPGVGVTGEEPPP
jgi:hypothetical protein